MEQSIFGDIKQIPKISKEELERRISLSIACLVREGDNGRSLINAGKVHPTNEAYTWGDKPGEVIGRIYSPRNVYVKEGNDHKCVAVEVGQFITLHEFGHPSLFKPSVKEVLSQLPEELFNEKKLAGKKLYFNTKAISDHAPSTLLGNDYHIGITTVWHAV